MTDLENRQRAAAIVSDAGGQVVGRTRLQKIACLRKLAGFDDGFIFEYRHYGPYCEELSDAIRMADAFGLVSEKICQANWGGTYSVYTATPQQDDASASLRTSFTKAAAEIDSIELELAATAAYLASEGCADPWEETARRKPEKAEDGRLDKAKSAYRKLLGMSTPKQLPAIV